MSEFTVSVFKEALFSRLMPVFRETTIDAVAKLQPDAYPQEALVAAVGAVIAYVMLYIIGWRMRALPARVSTEAQKTRIASMEKPAREWLPYALILAPTPFGTVLLLAAGFFRLKPVLAALVVLVSELFWRASPLFA